MGILCEGLDNTTVSIFNKNNKRLLVNYIYEFDCDDKFNNHNNDGKSLLLLIQETYCHKLD